ncbi:MAG: hypothetical protein FD123_3022 [Bacteroidetes bacterium]|nr:MAG: hypothetical protein FD123_3022 [Bacteroidota bacterium]
MKHFTHFLILSLITSAAFGQDMNAFGKLPNEEGDSAWAVVPKIHKLTYEEQHEGALSLLDERVIEYAWEGMNFVQTRDIYYTYYSKHTIVHLNSDRAIEDFNKVYIPMQDAIGDPVEIKARSISPDGKVIDLKNSDIKVLENYENRGRYVLFAIDGVQKGGEIEYYYKIKRNFQSFGSEYRKSNFPTRVLSIKVKTNTEKLEVRAKGYNGLTDISSENESNLHHYYYYKVKGNPHEEFSAGDAVLPRVEYKAFIKIDAYGFNILYGTYKNGPTWKTMSENIWLNIHTITPKEIRKSKKLLKPLKIQSLSSDEMKIIAIEQFIKTNFKIKDTQTSYDEQLRKILKTRIGNATGITRLYMCLFEAYKIDYWLAVTSNRYVKRFDSQFPCSSFFHDYLFYFYKTSNKFLSPTNETSRLGYPPQEFICNEALFFNGTQYGIKEVSCIDWKNNQSNINAQIRFNLEEGIVNGNFEMVNTGYFAGDYQVPYLEISSEADRQKFLNDVLDNYSGKDKPKNVSITGASSKDLYVNPCILKMDYSSNAILEKAGPKYIFHVGEVIGPQSQLYSDTARVTDVENRNQHGFIRKITIHIPEGYKITNPDALNMDVHHDDKGTRTAEFISRYTLTGDMLVVDIQETYRQLRYPVSQYEDFRKVINAAADFNKVVLFLEKK